MMLAFRIINPLVSNARRNCCSGQRCLENVVGQTRLYRSGTRRSGMDRLQLSLNEVVIADLDKFRRFGLTTPFLVHFATFLYEAALLASRSA